MKTHPHPHTRSGNGAVIITVILLSAVFGTVLYIQAVLYGQCIEPNDVKTVEELQSYLKHYAAHLRDEQKLQAAHDVGSALERVTHDSNTLPQKTAELMALQNKLTQAEQEAATANKKVQELTAKVEQMEDSLVQFDQKFKDLDKQKSDAAQQTKQQITQLQQEKDQLTKEKEQLEKDKLELQDKQQTASTTSAAPDSPSTDAAVAAAKLSVLAVAGDQCNPVTDYEFWADPILVWGYDHRTADAGECCAACHGYRRVVERGGTEKGSNSSTCNIWAFCGDRDKCKERFGECWLKHESALGETAPPALPPRAKQAAGWTSGAVYENHAQLNQYNNTGLVFHTSLGDIEMDLLPDLAPASVREVRRMAVLLAGNNNKGYCSNCKIYRPEKGFLVQGIMEHAGAYVATPRHPNPPQRMVMEKGLVCWAGGGGGPHWFVNMIDQSGFKDDHLCFAKASEQSMAIFDKILELPLKEKKNPNDMNGLAEPVRYNVTLRQLSQAAPQPSAPAAQNDAASQPAAGDAYDDPYGGDNTPPTDGTAAP